MAKRKPKPLPGGSAPITGDHVPPLESRALEERPPIVPASDEDRPASGAANCDEKDAPGLACPRCGCRHFEVVYTRPSWGGRIQRRRECRHCGRRMTTTERAV